MGINSFPYTGKSNNSIDNSISTFVIMDLVLFFVYFTIFWWLFYIIWVVYLRNQTVADVDMETGRTVPIRNSAISEINYPATRFYSYSEVPICLTSRN